MLSKTVIFAILAVGVLAQDLQVSEEQRQKVRDALRERCKKNGAEDKVEQIETAAKTFIECLKGLVDVNVLKNEIEEAKPNGSLDEVFKKYCAKTPQLKTCVHTVLDAFEPCLETSQKDKLPTAKKVTDELVDFVCYKDGDRIALFIAEKGPECFQQQADAIRGCANTVKNSVPTIEAAKALTTAEQCTKVDELTSCIVTNLEKCSTPTPANMAESLFRFVRKGSICPTK